jgi:hypothetical protein
MILMISWEPNHQHPQTSHDGENSVVDDLGGGGVHDAFLVRLII